MIYIEEKTFERQIDLLGYLSEQDSYYICAWLYPESNVTSIVSQKVDPSKLESVTTYGDGIKPKHTQLVHCSKKSLEAFVLAKPEIVKYCDSLALYKSNDSSWSAVTIGHEGMCLVRDKSILQKLISAGFAASTEVPSWW